MTRKLDVSITVVGNTISCLCPTLFLPLAAATNLVIVNHRELTRIVNQQFTLNYKHT